MCDVASVPALTLTPKLSPDTVTLEKGQPRRADRRPMGTGDLELAARKSADIDKDKPVIGRA